MAFDYHIQYWQVTLIQPALPTRLTDMVEDQCFFYEESDAREHFACLSLLVSRDGSGIKIKLERLETWSLGNKIVRHIKTQLDQFRTDDMTE